MEHFFSPNSGEDQKKKEKKVFIKKGTLFSPNSRGDLRSDAHHSQINGGDADVYHTQIIRGDTVKLLGRIYPPSSTPGFGTSATKYNNPTLNVKYYFNFTF